MVDDGSYSGVWVSGCGMMPSRAPAPLVPVKLQGKTLAFTLHQAPEFVSIMPAEGKLGSVMAALDLSPGVKNNDIVWRNQIPDPALAITANVSAALKNAYGMNVLPNPVPGTAAKPAALAAVVRGQADFLLDVKTTLWRTAYINSSWARYYVEHKAEAQLIDARDGTVLSSKTCSFVGRDKPDAPTWNDMVGNGASRLKQEFADVATNCSEVLKEVMLGRR